jgi:hypothetical protein
MLHAALSRGSEARRCRASPLPSTFPHHGDRRTVTDAFRDRLQTALGTTYTLGDELVGGGMSRVFVAIESALGRKVVIKVLPPELSAGVNRERFQREIQLAAQLQHPHIVPLLSAGELGDLLYYTMPFIEGESLRAALARRHALPVRDVVRILHDVVEALAYAHQRGVIHRDIKPGNILMLGSHALVTDFGVAKALSAALPISGMTSAGMAIGTPAYMAPEQLAADPNADHRMDLYAVGLVAYETLTGESPFTGESPQATMAAQLTRVPPPLDQVRDDVPPELSAIIMRCLEKLPEHRPSSALALLEELEGVTTPRTSVPAAYGSGSGVRAANASTVKLPAQSAPSAGRNRQAYVALGVLILALGGAIVLRGGIRPKNTVTLASDSARGATARDSAPVRVDTVVRQSPAVLTRADSLAIAEAVRKRMTAHRDSQPQTVSRVRADSLIAAMQRAINDSLIRTLAVLRARRDLGGRSAIGLTVGGMKLDTLMLGRRGSIPNPTAMPTPPIQPIPPVVALAPGMRHVIVLQLSNYTAQPQLTTMGRALADSLRRGVSQRNGYDVRAVMQDSADPTAHRRLQQARSMGVGAIVRGSMFLRRDSLVIRVQVEDLTPRGRTRSVQVMAALSDPMRGTSDLVANVLRNLDAIDWAAVDSARVPGRRPGPPPD